jgi:glycosyltransferase involved in cell wall biosynthesis
LTSGTSVCATPVGEIPMYLEDRKSIYYAEPSNSVSFAEIMLEAIQNKDQSKIIGTNEKDIAELYFNSTIQSELLVNFFTKLYYAKNPK